MLSTSRPDDALQWDSKFVLTSDEHKWFSDSPLTHPSLWSGWSLLSRSCRICRHHCRRRTGLLLQRNRWCCHSRFSAEGRVRKQKDSKSYKNVKKKFIGMNEFVHVDCKMSLQTCMLLICLHNTKRSSSHSSKTKPNTPKFVGSNGLYLVDTVSSIDYFIY